MGRSSSEVKILYVNIGKGYVQEMWAARTPRNSYLVETVKPCVSDVH